ncbi:chemotaxis response regulator protein-glutamate methylesterase [Roseomonas sp. CCTCC AB2023176]|uniref:protein-glutamate methylesterase/protein-glutamine glutaminase n=1 Tax=Roseomonas sp. CCTCC AB2023176 TaxID=3342640 RepID=UPI0035DE1911
MTAIRVVVVDDSATMRALIAATLRRDPDLQVVAEAADPFEARAAIKAHDPHVVTLDVEMPGMNGLDFLERIMRLRPMPVVMVSSLTQAGAEATVQALAIGAVDCVAKPDSSGRGFADLPARVRAAAGARVGQRWAPPAPVPGPFGSERRLIAIGASTGGVEALHVVLGALPADAPPVIVTQHMPANFLSAFAARLNRHCAMTVLSAEDGLPIRPGQVYVAGGGYHLEVTGSRDWRCRTVEGPPVNGHRPSVDVMLQSAARAAGARGIGVILTGMGKDGAAGLLAMRRAGARTLAQDEATSVVHGMPRVAWEIGAAERLRPLNAIARDILDLCRARLPETA